MVVTFLIMLLHLLCCWLGNAPEGRRELFSAYVGRLSYDNVRERSTRTYRKEHLEKLLDLICVVPIPL